jgi:hypothetical protein
MHSRPNNRLGSRSRVCSFDRNLDRGRGSSHLGLDRSWRLGLVVTVAPWPDLSNDGDSTDKLHSSMAKVDGEKEPPEKQLESERWHCEFRLTRRGLSCVKHCDGMKKVSSSSHTPQSSCPNGIGLVRTVRDCLC